MPERSIASCARANSSRAIAKSIAARVAGVDGVAQDLRGGEVDLHDARRLQHDQPWLLSRGMQQSHQIPPEMIRIEK